MHRLERRKHYAAGPAAHQANRANSGLQKGFSPLRRAVSLMRKNYLAKPRKCESNRQSISRSAEIVSVSAPLVWSSITTKMRLLSLRLARDIANRIGAQQTLFIAQGNAGWAYYETGDYARALANFNAAAASAARLGSPIDEEHWLDTAGMSEARLGNLDSARDRYDRALVLARSLKNNSEIAQVDQALGSLFLHGPQPGARAKIHR